MRPRLMAMNIVLSRDCKGQIVVSYALYVVAIARGALVSARGALRGRSQSALPLSCPEAIDGFKMNVVPERSAGLAP